LLLARKAFFACLAIGIIASMAGVAWLGDRMDQLGHARKAQPSGDYLPFETLEPDELRDHTARLARDLIDHHRITEARGYLERALAGREDAGLLELLGVCCEQEGALEKAEEYWRRAVALDSMNSAALLDLGRLAISARRLKEAVSLLERAAELSPGSIDPVYNLSRAYRLQGDIAKAKHFEHLADRLRQSEPPRGGMGAVPAMLLETPSSR
jgi:Flp pilus assembly protein TadD